MVKIFKNKNETCGSPIHRLSVGQDFDSRLDCLLSHKKEIIGKSETMLRPENRNKDKKKEKESLSGLFTSPERRNTTRYKLNAARCKF